VKSIRLADVQANLGELVDALPANGGIVITRDDQPVARLVADGPRPSLSQIVPASVGAILRPLSPDDDLLEEMSS
jgi:antitoxin (DNA-binding transcriptional repressor) of toxin-antitoxin stability system